MTQTRKILVTLSTGYCGMTKYAGWEIPVTMTDDEIWDLVDAAAVENAEAYGIYRESEEDDDGEEEVESRYSGHNIDGGWKDYEAKDAGKITYSREEPVFEKYE